MKKLMTILIAASAITIASTVTVSAEKPADGFKAFENGQYPTALRLLAQEADNGSTDALYALGLMHEYGLGVSTSASQAASYYFKGAQINTFKKRSAQARLFVNALQRTAQ